MDLGILNCTQKARNISETASVSSNFHTTPARRRLTLDVHDHDPRPPTHPSGLESARMDGEMTLDVGFSVLTFTVDL
ncbi:hypothetical protein AVEN_203470-1 [Araneus ventricosus]|uniref:Uncharacterized protein n=1 Tax=Araneus ventricosus TaxID=182803 RepID=A0A4Y2BJ92_ARAVE|nr:hypothetical protein AVEN_203470-1 [Araneus ventricosus]